MFRFDDYILYICLQRLANLFFQACLNHALVGGADVFQPEGHSVEAERPVWGYKCRYGLIGVRHLDLMVSGVWVEETH